MSYLLIGHAIVCCVHFPAILPHLSFTYATSLLIMLCFIAVRNSKNTFHKLINFYNSGIQAVAFKKSGPKR